jgi:hypothetical protein
VGFFGDLLEETGLSGLLSDGQAALFKKAREGRIGEPELEEAPF